MTDKIPYHQSAQFRKMERDPDYKKYVAAKQSVRITKQRIEQGLPLYEGTLERMREREKLIAQYQKDNPDCKPGGKKGMKKVNKATGPRKVRSDAGVTKGRRPTNNYLNNHDLLKDVIESQEKGVMSDVLAKKLMLLVDRYATRPNFSGYTYVDDMKGYAIMQLCISWEKFKPAKSSNPFAFFTQCIKNSFIQYLTKERKHRDIRDAVMTDQGLNASFTYQEKIAEIDKHMHTTSQSGEKDGN